MFRVGVALFPDVYLYSVGALLDSFDIANGHLRQQQGEPAVQFSCTTIAADEKPIRASGGLRLKADTTFSEAGEFDLIHVPAFAYEGMTAFEGLAERQKRLLDWLCGRWARGATIAANCTGTLLLAETGLLNGRRATTAWWLEQSFRRRFPRIRLDANSILTEDERLMTTGAMTANLNMAINLIERSAGPHMAAVCARTMLIDTAPQSQRPYQALQPETLSADPLVAKSQYWLQNHLGEAINQVALSAKMKVSQRTLIRRFKAELGVTPLTYLQNLRIEAAKRILENDRVALVEVVERVGYADISSFSRLFKAKTGLTPHTYRRRFSHGAPGRKAVAPAAG